MAHWLRIPVPEYRNLWILLVVSKNLAISLLGQLLEKNTQPLDSVFDT